MDEQRREREGGDLLEELRALLCAGSSAPGGSLGGAPARGHGPPRRTKAPSLGPRPRVGTRVKEGTRRENNSAGPSVGVFVLLSVCRLGCCCCMYAGETGPRPGEPTDEYTVNRNFDRRSDPSGLTYTYFLPLFPFLPLSLSSQLQHEARLVWLRQVGAASAGRRCGGLEALH